MWPAKQLHKYFSSISAKKALERRTKSASLSSTSSPILNFSTDFSGGSLIEAPAEFGHPGACRPAHCRPAFDTYAGQRRPSRGKRRYSPWCTSSFQARLHRDGGLDRGVRIVGL